MCEPEINEECLDHFRELAREVTLCLGGVFAVHEVPDDVIWQSAKSLDRIFERFLARFLAVDQQPDAPPKRKMRPHPAIEELLRHIDQIQPRG